ncbi:MAG: NTP transferase domain-containing protein [Candidatus Cloacimonadota bacterium]|nr:NTP transferase domain-containing protein [Candidatus Cloacimonadota bacterium]
MIQKKIYAIILAAGYSSRFSIFKPLAKYKSKYFIINIIENLCLYCDEIVIVTGYKSEFLKEKTEKALIDPEIKSKLRFVYNEHFPAGMFSSVQTAAKYLNRKIDNDDWILLHLVDQPHIPKQVYKRLILSTETSKNEIIIPSYEMHSGHPILFRKEVVKKIISSTTAKTLKDIIKKFSIEYISVEQKQILQDVDLDEDVARFL